MEECELCGRAMGGIYVVEVEGVELRICAKCANGKRVIRKEEPAEKKGKKQAQAMQMPRKKRPEEADIVDNYSNVIREAREKMDLPLKVLAEMINEKETLLLRIEQNKTVPSVELAKKLEKALGVKLEQQQEEKEDRHSKGKKEEATLGEFIN